jgi:hypothetical protein
LSPAAQTSLFELPQTARRLVPEESSNRDQATPVKCAMSPESPTAHTSFVALPQTASRFSVASTATFFHDAPS